MSNTLYYQAAALTADIALNPSSHLQAGREGRAGEPGGGRDRGGGGDPGPGGAAGSAGGEPEVRGGDPSWLSSGHHG